MRRKWTFGRWFSDGGVFFVVLLVSTVVFGLVAAAASESIPLWSEVLVWPVCACMGIAALIFLDRSTWGFRLDAVCEGTVVETGVSCDENSTRWAKVRYRVGGVEYVRKIALRLKTAKVIRVGRLPIGRRLAPGVGELKAGDAIRVAYDGKHPKRCDIVGNEGWTY